MAAAKQRPASDVINHYKWLVLAAAVAAQMTAAVATQGIGVLAGFMQSDLHLSNADVGILAGALNVGPILGLLVVGQWLDRTSVRIVIGAGAIAMGLAMTLTQWVDTFGMLLLCLFLIGVGYSTAQPGGSKAVFHWFPARERGLAMGVRQAGLPLGGAIAAAIFPGIAIAAGWRTAFLAGAAIIVAGGALFCLVYRAPSSGTEPLQARRRPQPLAHARLLLATSEFRRAALSGVMLVTVQTVALMFLIIFLRDHFRIPLVDGAVYLLAMQLAGAAGRILLAAWSDHARKGRATIVLVAIAGALLGLIGLALFPDGGDTALLFPVVAWLGFFGFGWYGPWVAWVSEAASREHVGATLGLAMSINQVAVVAAPIVFGILVDATSGYLVPGIVLIAALAGYIAWFGLRRPA
jgi:MFS family permease